MILPSSLLSASVSTQAARCQPSPLFSTPCFFLTWGFFSHSDSDCHFLCASWLWGYFRVHGFWSLCSHSLLGCCIFIALRGGKYKTLRHFSLASRHRCHLRLRNRPQVESVVCGQMQSGSWLLTQAWGLIFIHGHDGPDLFSCLK